MPGFEVGLSFGSNIGDKAANIKDAMKRLMAAQRVRLKAVSHLYRTAPWGKVDQDFFANAAALAETRLKPLELLAHVKKIESDMGRTKQEHWGPRLIDIDLLFYGDLVLDDPRLTLPHREMFNRAFVLVPLAEIAAGRRIGGRLVGEAALAMAGEGVERWEKPDREPSGSPV